jgi:hypothetical protein
MQRIFAALLASVIASASASAGAIADKAAQAESLAADGKYLEAIDVLNQATIPLWGKSPLSFRKALWVAERPRGFGSYNPRETNAYKGDDKMIAYAEPVGFGWRKAGDIWHSDLAADCTLKSKDGKPVASQTLTGASLDVSTRSPVFMGHFIHFILNMSGFSAGEYVADFTVRDAVSGKRGTFSLPFVIVAP